MIARLLLILLLPLVGWFASPPAAAHDATTTAYATATGAAEDVVVVLELEYDLLMKSAWLYAEAYRATERAEQLRQLEANEHQVSTYVVERFQVAYDEQRCAGQATRPATIVDRGDRAFAAVTVRYDCTGQPEGQHAFFSALFPDGENFVHSTRTVLQYDLGGVTGSAVMEAARPRHDVTGAALSEQGVKTSDSAMTRLWHFGVLGAEHLLLGPDHLLFLLALLIGARGWRDVVLSATTFTVAHSVTFALASLGLVSVPSAVVEPLIAASIVVVALLGLRARRSEATSWWRVPVVFGFGLLHGLGFAGALGIDTPRSWDLLWGLLAFNLGIEVAQLLLIVVVFPLLLAVRRGAVGARVAVVVTASVALTGVFWLVERLFVVDALAVLG